MRALAALAVVACALPLVAQAPAASEESAATLHVFADRVQIPVLVRGPHRELLPRLDASQFVIHLDGQSPLKAAVRQQGADPLELSILVDSSDAHNALLPALAKAFAALPADVIQPQDHVAVFGMDGCKLRRFHTMDPFEGAAGLSKYVQMGADSPAFSTLGKAATCANHTTLWDALYYLVQSMRELPGRRVVLVVTNGPPSEPGVRGATDVWNAAVSYGVSIFGIARKGKLQVLSRTALPIATGGSFRALSPSALISASETSGGMVMDATPATLNAALADSLQAIRNRYILEFPRPEGLVGMHHRLNVEIKSMHTAFVRSGGITFPAKLRQPAEVVELDGLPPLVLPPVAPEVENASAAAPAEGASDSAATVTVDVAATPAAVAEAKPAYDPTDITDELFHHGVAPAQHNTGPVSAPATPVLTPPQPAYDPTAITLEFQPTGAPIVVAK